MRMGMVPALRQQQDCKYCDGTADEHSAGCPFAELMALEQRRKLYRCPLCHNSVELNRSDYFECRGCNAQFTAGAAGFEERLGRNVLVAHGGETLTVEQLKEKGEGNFYFDLVAGRLRERMRKIDEEVGEEE